MKKYTLNFEITDNGLVSSTETIAGMEIWEVIGLLEMQKAEILNRLNTSSRAQLTINTKENSNGEK